MLLLTFKQTNKNKQNKFTHLNLASCPKSIPSNNQKNISLTMGVSQFIAISLRVCELAFSAVVAGITGSYLNQANIKQASSFSKRDFICTEGGSLPPLKSDPSDKFTVVAGLGIFFALLFLLPIRWSFVVDFILFILWMVAFGLLADVSSYSPPSSKRSTQLNSPVHWSSC